MIEKLLKVILNQNKQTNIKIQTTETFEIKMKKTKSASEFTLFLLQKILHDGVHKISFKQWFPQQPYG